MKEYAVIIAVLILVVLGGLWAANGRIAKAPGQACTMEAKLCPDGSAVARTGPNCEFAECPKITPSSNTSGVRGFISLGPTCPVERIPPDPACADKPFVTPIQVYTLGSELPYKMGNSDATGAFTFSLPPGSYRIDAIVSQILPRCNEAIVTVYPNAYATTTISCDTGIR